MSPGFGISTRDYVEHIAERLDLGHRSLIWRKQYLQSVR